MVPFTTSFTHAGSAKTSRMYSGGLLGSILAFAGFRVGRVETRLVKYSWLMAEGWTLQLRCREERERRSRRLHELCGASVGAEICGGGAFGG